MKKSRKQLIKVLFVCSMVIVLTAAPVHASADKTISAEEVFPEEQVKMAHEVARSKPISDYNEVKGINSRKALKSTGSYPKQKGVILITGDAYKGLIPTGHAAIVWTPSLVVESLANGVTTGPNNWDVSKDTCEAVTVRGTTYLQDSEAANWCYRQIGKPYNYDYFNVNTRSKFYCSQLVWASFKDNYGIDLNTSLFGNAVHPVELEYSSNTSIIYEK
ncbi:MAG: hypothetical protein E7241_07760 [Lachnospiraceae bacterium]|jgi:uncharacterized protein YycO|nr:hypothetical protein [Lachnospiraceae bacterium]